MREAISSTWMGCARMANLFLNQHILHLCRTARIIGDERGNNTLFCFELRFSIDNRATALPGTPATFASARDAATSAAPWLNLTDALARDRERLPTSSSVCSLPSSRPKRILMTFSSRGVSVLQHRERLLLQIQVDDRVRGRHHGLVLDEIPKVRILFFTDWSLQRNGLLRDFKILRTLDTGCPCAWQFPRWWARGRVPHQLPLYAPVC